MNPIVMLAMLYGCQFNCMVETFVRPVGIWPVPNSRCITLGLFSLFFSNELQTLILYLLFESRYENQFFLSGNKRNLFSRICVELVVCSDSHQLENIIKYSRNIDGQNLISLFLLLFECERY